MVIPVAKPNGQYVRRMLPHGRRHINQRCSHCHKRAIKLWRKIVFLFYLGNMVVRCPYFLHVLLGWRSYNVSFWSSRSRCDFRSPCTSANLNLNFFLWTRITLQKHSLDSMTARWLLPVMTLMVASASGGILGGAIRVYSQLHSFQTLLVSVFMVSVGFTLTLMILTIYLMRLFLHGLPPDAKVLSVFLPIGPTSQSGYTILLIGQNFHKLLPFPPHWQSSEFFNYSSTGTIVEVVCTCGSFILWSLATMWILYALLAMYSGVRSKIPFKAASFWGLVFPNVTSL